MTTPDPGQDSPTAPFAPPTPPVPQPVFAAPEPAPVPVQPVAAAPVAAGVAASGGGAPATRGSARLLNAVLGVAVLVAVAGIAFAVGRTTAPAGAGSVASLTDPNAGGGAGSGNGQGPLGGQGPGAGFDLNGNGGGPDDDGDGVGRGPFGGFGASIGISGTVQSVSADSVTISLPDGTAVTFGIDGSTTYHLQADATASDVTVGSTVIVDPAGGFRPGRGTGNGTDGLTLGTAGSITVVP
jgi:hypothetical protein